MTTPPTVADGPQSTNFLLGLVRKLIDYDKQLFATMRQYPPATLPSIPRYAGTIDIGLILARIACGLNRAAALEARLLRRARQEQKPTPPRPPSPPQPRAALPAARRPAHADPHLARLPTVEEIADQVRHRPLGAVIADICRDLGILPSHPLWRELSWAVVANGGNLAALCKRIFARPMVSISGRFAIALPARPAGWLPGAGYATGPP